MSSKKRSSGSRSRLVRRAERILADLNLRDPGTQHQRPARVSETILIVAGELRRLDPDLPEPEARRAAEAAIARIDTKFHSNVVKHMERLGRTSTTARRSRLSTAAEMHAVLRLPQMRWLWTWLGLARSGRPATRGRPLALLFYMAWSATGPVMSQAWDAFEGSMRLAWVFGWRTKGPRREGCYVALRGLTEHPLKDPDVMLYINAELIRELADRTADGKPLHPDAFKYLSVDGKGIQADIRQCKPHGADANDPVWRAHEALMRGGRKLARFGIHKSGGRVTKRLFGYVLVSINSVTLGLPLVWAVFPYPTYEPDCVEILLRRLHELYPEHAVKSEFLVADALYDTDTFHRTLWQHWSIHLVCPEKTEEGYRKDERFWKGSRVDGGKGDFGVPACACGLMKRHKPEGFVTAEQRVARGIRFGDAVEQNPRIRWVCPVGRCEPRTTRPFVYPRLYTFLPRTGTHTTAALREALLARRNDSESVFHLVKYFGLDGQSPLRARWATDRGMIWLLNLNLTYLTARRLVHVTGRYDRSLAEANALEVLEWHEPRRGLLDGEVIQAAAAERIKREEADPPRAPEAWLREHPEDRYLRGYSAPDSDEGLAA